MNKKIDTKMAVGILAIIVLAAGFIFWRGASQTTQQAAPTGNSSAPRHIKPGGPMAENVSPSGMQSGNSR